MPKEKKNSLFKCFYCQHSHQERDMGPKCKPVKIPCVVTAIIRNTTKSQSWTRKTIIVPNAEPSSVVNMVVQFANQCFATNANVHALGPLIDLFQNGDVALPNFPSPMAAAGRRCNGEFVFPVVRKWKCRRHQRYASQRLIFISRSPLDRIAGWPIHAR